MMQSTLRSIWLKQHVLLPDHPVYLDLFLEGAIECDVDALCDGKQVYIGGVLEHIEEAGVHSGDSACCIPPFTLSDLRFHNCALLPAGLHFVWELSDY